MVNRSTLKQRMKKKGEIICVFLRIPDPMVAEVLARGGVNLFVLDGEHYCFDECDMVNIFRACELYGADCMVRLSEVDKAKIGRLLDAGATGILLADVESAEQIINLVSAVKYAPQGKRGVSTDSRNNQYGYEVADLQAYPQIQNDRTLIGAIIETDSAIKELDEILKIPQLDLVSVGTMDLSFALGMPGQIDAPDVINKKKAIYDKIVAAGKIALDKCATEQSIHVARERGIKCFYISSDVSLLKNGLESILKMI
ncbi:MAG: HpcH/HpaI aldolase/citrate lyase family protein [Oliverpabstia sp.]